MCLGYEEYKDDRLQLSARRLKPIERKLSTQTRPIGESAKINLNDMRYIGTDIRSVTARISEWEEGIVSKEDTRELFGWMEILCILIVVMVSYSNVHACQNS